MTVVDLGLDDLVARRRRAGADPRLALARAANEAAAKPGAARSLDPLAFAALLKMESSGQLSATQSKEVLAELIERGGDPAQIAARLGFEQMDTAALEAMVDEVIAANPEEWQALLRRRRESGAVPSRPGHARSKGKANGKARRGAASPRRSHASRLRAVANCPGRGPSDSSLRRWPTRSVRSRSTART